MNLRPPGPEPDQRQSSNLLINGDLQRSSFPISCGNELKRIEVKVLLYLQNHLQSRYGAEMENQDLLARVVTDASVCGGQPCIRGTRILVSTILDGMVEGLSAEQILDHYPSLQIDDIRASVAYGAELARENVWKLNVR